MSDQNEMWNVKEYPPHMQGDAQIHNENVKAGRELCDRCEGTGNQLLSMYQSCEKCGGSGFIKKPLKSEEEVDNSTSSNTHMDTIH